MPVSVKLIGRLGNQLFQYAAMRNIALIKNYNIYYNTNFEWHGQKCLLDNFNIERSCENFRPGVRYNQKIDKSKSRMKGGDSSTYDEKILKIQDNTLLSGFFQNEKYFLENREIIKKELTLKKELDDICENYINEIYQKNKDYKIVGIHLRRGDSVSQHLFNFDNIDKFIKKAIKKIKEKEKKIYIIFFTGGATLNKTEIGSKRRNNWLDNNHTDDINWLNSYIKSFDEKFEISKGTYENNELIDYGLLSKCDYNILPNASSFSWMASYVNKKNDGKVYVNALDALHFMKPPDKFEIL